ncbi:MAG: YdcF family protein [Flavobacteriales bacterium]|nr:YdcF family protein [Flavobacteriales bacterium]
MFNKWTIGSTLFLILFIVFSNWIIISSAKKSVYSTVSETPKGYKVALLLGTSRYTVRGTTNLYFKYRIKAAADLYRSGKIKHIIVSGDNRVENYNEPKQMQEALMALGVPESAITLDYAGFRTLDSVVRSKEVFGQSKIIIVSQRFHVERALFIARKYNIDAIGFSAQDPPEKYSLKTRIREVFAKTKAVIDLYIINKKPKFLGKKETIII